MLLYLARHAPALATPHLGLDARRLARAVGRRLLDLGAIPARIATSPEPSCVQTAELLAQALDHLGEIVVVPLLSARTPGHLLAREALALGDGALIVAGEPVLAMLAAALIGKPSFPPSREGQVSVLENREPTWLLDPRTLEKAPLLVA
jgi:phosphohistidine phosphatase SixA